MPTQKPYIPVIPKGVEEANAASAENDLKHIQRELQRRAEQASKGPQSHTPHARKPHVREEVDHANQLSAERTQPKGPAR